MEDNDTFDDYIRSKNITSYDASYPMFRWHVDIKASILSAQIPGVGNVTDVNVVSRGLGGIASEVDKRRWRKLQDQRPESGKKYAWKYRTCNKETGRNEDDRNSVPSKCFYFH